MDVFIYFLLAIRWQEYYTLLNWEALNLTKRLRFKIIINLLKRFQLKYISIPRCIGNIYWHFGRHKRYIMSKNESENIFRNWSGTNLVVSNTAMDKGPWIQLPISYLFRTSQRALIYVTTRCCAYVMKYINEFSVYAIFNREIRRRHE